MAGVNVKTMQSQEIKTNYVGHVQLAREGHNDDYRNCKI
jgi:hypothetical protein